MNVALTERPARAINGECLSCTGAQPQHWLPGANAQPMLNRHGSPLRMPWAVSALKLSANDEQVCLRYYGEKPAKALYQKTLLNGYLLTSIKKGRIAIAATQGGYRQQA